MLILCCFVVIFLWYIKSCSNKPECLHLISILSNLAALVTLAKERQVTLSDVRGQRQQSTVWDRERDEGSKWPTEMRAQTVKKGFPGAAALIRLTCPLRFTTTPLSSQPPSPHKTHRRVLPLLSNLLRC